MADNDRFEAWPSELTQVAFGIQVTYLLSDGITSHCPSSLALWAFMQQAGNSRLMTPAFLLGFVD